MGYVTQLILSDVILPRGQFAAFRKSLEAHQGDPDCPFGWMPRFVHLYSNEAGEIDWNLSDEYRNSCEILDEDPTPISKVSRRTKHLFVQIYTPDDSMGKWYNTENFVTWLSHFGVSGRILQVSQEGDGGDLGMGDAGGWPSQETGFRSHRSMAQASIR